MQNRLITFAGTFGSWTKSLSTIVLLGLFLSLLPRSYGAGVFPKTKLVEGNDGSFYGTTEFGGSGGPGTVFRVTPKIDGGWKLTTLVEFDGTNGKTPSGGLLKGSDGNFYGTTFGDPATVGDQHPKVGTFFRMTPTGALTTLVTFDALFSGACPSGGLVEGRDGYFYGTTELDGISDDGTVFKVTPAGALTQLVRFDRTFGDPNDLSDPTGRLVRKSDGTFYGTSVKGGANNQGAVFKISPGAFEYKTTLVSFDGIHGSGPRAGLTIGLDGNFYGTTETGGTNDKGTVFKLTPAGVLTTLVHFDGTHGRNPRAALVKGADGNFYGTTTNGGTNDKGTVFKVTPAGALTTLVSFDGTTNSSYPAAELVPGRDGNFYGTTAGDPSTINAAQKDFGSVFKVTPAGALTKLVDFAGLVSDGNSDIDISAISLSGAVEGNDGNFYATTVDGGTNDKGRFLKLSADGTSGTTLVSFGGANGSRPGGVLVKGSDGSIYGTTTEGGTNDLGTIFKVTPEGVLTTLASFDGTHGAAPTGRLLLASNGNFYGTTTNGGTNDLGTVFKMTPTGTLTTLVDFNGLNGSFPVGLIQGTDGNFYGTTTEGGKTYDPGVEPGVGTVFKVTPAGALTTVADFYDTFSEASYYNYSFYYSPAGLVQGSDGNFYGFTAKGGYGDYGSVFKLTPAGALTTLVKFAIGNGSYPDGLVQGSDGNLYGTTTAGGLGGKPSAQSGFVGEGTVFRITPAGALTTLVNFNVLPGSYPALPFFGSDGQLCGVAQTLFRIPLKPGGPTLTAPAPDTATKGPLHVAFTLPETAQPGSVKLTFSRVFALGGTVELTLAGSQETSGAHSFTFDAFNPSASPEIADGDAIAELPFPFSSIPPFFMVSLSYRDTAGDPGPIVTTASYVTIDKTPPIVVPHQDIDVTTSEPGTIVNYDAPQAVDPSGPVTLSYSKKSGTFFNAGTTTVTVTAEDRAHNQATTSFEVRVHAPFPGVTGVLAQGDPAPGHGTAGGLPDDAVIASFGLPAIDELGNLAYVAKWTSASGKTKGAGLFFNDMCLALVGGDASAIAPGAKWKSFTDPVVSEGCVVCIATLTGVKTGTTAIVGNFYGPALVKIARTGEAAAGESVGGAKFKSFKAVTVQTTVDVIPRVAFLAQLTAGTGTPKVGPTNDVGLWYYEPDYPVFVVRKGDEVAGRKIKTLGAFLPGNGSPGQGRGTLVNSTVTGTPLVTALALFTNGTQGLIMQDLNDGSPTLALSLSGDAATGVDDGKTFAGYGLPASISDEATAFLGTLTIGNGVTKADASGIFTGPDGNGKFAKVIRVGEDAMAAGTGAKFTLLKDPVLSEDGAIAFPATVSVKGPGAQTLWWKPAGQPLALLAQAGADATELAGSKWKAFTSLAVAGGGRGPIFAATTTPGNGSGVWATDSTGAKRLLFRTGSQIDAGGTKKTVKSFTLLKASVGSMGVTRSINNAAQVVWLATFTDKSQAIVTTEVP